MDITLNDLRKFKKFNMEILPDLVKFIDRSEQQNVRWRHYDNQTSWIKNKEVDKDKIKISNIKTNINKISLNNYDTIVDILVKEEYTSDMLESSANFIFNKIINEINNLDLFIRLISDLKKIPNFNRLFMNKCQKVFKEIENANFDNGVDLECIKNRDELKTYIIFIAKMGLAKLLGIPIIINCAYSLITKIINKYNDIDLLVIYNFMNILLNKSINNIFIDYLKENDNLIDEFREKFQTIKNNKELSKKELFQMVDIIELFDDIEKLNN
jgi:hypothetical protein